MDNARAYYYDKARFPTTINWNRDEPAACSPGLFGGQAYIGPGQIYLDGKEIGEHMGVRYVAAPLPVRHEPFLRMMEAFR